jgi:hypothetical protein
MEEEERPARSLGGSRGKFNILLQYDWIFSAKGANV